MATWETTAVRLWMGNDEGLYHTARELVAEALENDEDAGTYLEAEMLEMKPDVEGVWADLLDSALSEVDWEAVAEDFMPDEDEDGVSA